MVAIVTGNGLGLQSGTASGLGQKIQIGNAALGQSGEQVYVNASNGNLLLQDRDQFLSGTGVNSEIFRSYNSQGKLTGDNWQPGAAPVLSLLTGVVNTAGSTIQRIDWDGSAITYTFDASRNSYLASSGTGARATLAFDAASNNWTYHDGKNQISETYDSLQRLTIKSDRDGNNVVYQYNSAGKLAQVTTAAGEITYLDYSGGNLTQIRTAYQEIVYGRQVVSVLTATRYTYDAQNRLSTVTLDANPTQRPAPDAPPPPDRGVYTTTYTYDGDSNRIASIAQSDGSQVAFTYVLAGGDYRVATVAQTSDAGVVRLTALEYGSSFAPNGDPAGSTTTITDPFGLKTTLISDSQGRLIQTSGPGDTEYKQFKYDDSGNVTQVVNSDTPPDDFTYDGNGNLIVVKDHQGTVTTRTFGADNELLTETVQVPDSLGGQTTTKRYAYDAHDHLRFTISAEGRVTEYRYNASGQKVTEIRYSTVLYDVGALQVNTVPNEAALNAWVAGLADNSRVMRIDTSYDFRGNVSTVKEFGAMLANGTENAPGEYAPGNPQEVRSGGSTQTDYIYDQFGRLLQKIGVDRELYSYDGLGRVLSTSRANGYSARYQYDDGKHQTIVSFGNGLTQISTYNGAGELIALTQSSSGTLLSQVLHAYDADGRLRMDVDANGQKTHYLYDKSGQRVAKIDPDGALTEYRYDSKQRHLVSTIRYATLLSAAQLATLIDDGGRPVDVAGPGSGLDNANLRPAASMQDRTQWNFYRGVSENDPDGSILDRTVDADGAVTGYRYDGNGRVVSMTLYAHRLDVSLPPGSSTSTVAADAANDRTTRYFYDKDGLLQATLNGEGYLTEYRYDAAGRKVASIAYAAVTSEELRIAGTLADLRPGSSADDIRHYYQYDGRGKLVAEVDGEGAVTTYTHNGNTIEQFQSMAKVDVSLWLLSGNVDSNGRILPVVELGSPDWAAIRDIALAPGVELRKTVYDYNADGKLLMRTSFDVASGNLTGVDSYGYDGMGNLYVEMLGNVTTRRSINRRYDAQNRLIGLLSGEGSAALAAMGDTYSQEKVDAIWASYGTRYSYDAAGRLISQTDPSGNTTLTYYNISGHVSHTVNALGEVAQFDYDAFGERTRQTVYGARLDAATLAKLAGGQLTAALQATFAALGADNSASVTDYQYNNAGEIVKQTDALGVETSYSYNSAGQRISTTVNTDKTNAASGQRIDTIGYDRLGQIILQTKDAGDLNLVTQASYDAFGRTVETVDANGVVRSQGYDRQGNVVVVTDGLGNKSQMTYDAFNSVLTSTDKTGHTTTYAYSPFKRDVTVTTAEGIVTTTSVNEFGDIIKITDGRGISSTYQYDHNGKLIGSTKAAGTDAAATVTSTYDGAGHLIATTDARGIQTTYTYDAANRVLTRTFDTADLNYKTTYGYDAKGQMVSVTDPNGVLTTTQYDKLGQKIVVIVDAGAGKLNLTTIFAYDGVGNQLTVTEGVGSTQPRVTEYAYDKAGRLSSKTIDPANLKLLTEYEYDGNGNVVLVRQNNEPVPTRYAYDAEGRVVYVVNQNGEVTQTGYDAAGRVTAKIALAASINLPAGAASVQDIIDLIAAQPASVRADDHVTQYAYDADGRLRYTVNGMNYVTEQVYDKAGNVVSITAYATSIAATVAIDGAAIAAALAAQAPASHAADRTTRTLYDAANRPVFSINAMGYVTQNTYDANGNLMHQTVHGYPYTEKANPTPADLDAWGTKIANTWGMILPSTTSWIYDGANRPRFIIDSLTYFTENRYDANNHIIQALKYAPYGSNNNRYKSYLQWTTTDKPYLPAESALTYYRYDGAGRPVGITDPTGVMTRYELDGLGNAVNTYIADGTAAQTVTHAIYDTVGRKIEETRAWGTAIASTSRYSYNAQGLLTAQYDPRAVELAEQDTDWALAQRKAAGLVDASGNGLKAVALDATQKALLMNRYVKATSYDVLGRVARTWTATDPSGIATSYDAFGNVASVTQGARTTVFSYNKSNKNTLQTTGDGAVVQTAYSAFGDPVTVTQYYNAAVAGTLPTASPRDAVTQLEYDKLGRLVKSTDAEGFNELYDYGARGKRISYTNKSGSLFRYEYDRDGNLTTEYLPNNTHNNYGYDAFGNVAWKVENDNAGTPSSSTSYGYDKLGHVTIIAGRPVTVTSATGSTSTATPIQRFTYDARGNQTSATDANGNTSYQYYDALNRKIGDISAIGTYTSYVYDSAGNVVTTRVYAVPVTVTTPDTTPAAPTNLTGMRETNNVYDASNRLIESRIMNVGTGQFYADAKDPNNPGRPGMYYIDSESTIVRRWTYDTRGNAISSIDPNGNQVFSFYDVNGKKVLDIDAQGYGTAWVRDLFGNVTEQRQYALRYTDAFTSSSDPQSIINAWARSGDDRITQYAWDRNSRLTSETRTGVDYATVDNSGAMTEVKGGNAITSYQYDGDGHLLHKTDANGSQSDFTYDKMGHLSSQMLPQFVDYLNRQVRSTTLFEYDSLNHLTKETLKGATAAEDRITVYTYGTDGRMASKTDAVGTVTSYGYDVNGNTVQTSFIRLDASGNKIKDTTRISYDVANREISRNTQSTDPDTGRLLYGDTTTEMQYNTFGEVTGRRTNGGGANGQWQQYAQYDNAGRVMRSNFDGGMSHLYMYDKNGNATLKMESMTTDLRIEVIATVADLQKLVQEVQLNQTFTRYDARNQVIQIMQPKVSAGAPQITFRPIDVPIDGGTFANTEVWLGGSIKRPAGPVPGPANPSAGEGAILAGSGGSASVSADWAVTKKSFSGTDGVAVNSLSINVPDLTAIYGAYRIEARVSYTVSGQLWQYRNIGGGDAQYIGELKSFNKSGAASSGSVPGSPRSLSVDISYFSGAQAGDPVGDGDLVNAWGPQQLAGGSGVNFSYTVEFYVTPESTGGKPQFIGSIDKTAQLFGSVDTSVYHAESDSSPTVYSDIRYTAAVDGLNSTQALSLGSHTTYPLATSSMIGGSAAPVLRIKLPDLSQLYGNYRVVVDLQYAIADKLLGGSTNNVSKTVDAGGMTDTIDIALTDGSPGFLGAYTATVRLVANNNPNDSSVLVTLANSLGYSSHYDYKKLTLPGYQEKKITASVSAAGPVMSVTLPDLTDMYGDYTVDAVVTYNNQSAFEGQTTVGGDIVTTVSQDHAVTSLSIPLTVQRISTAAGNGIYQYSVAIRLTPKNNPGQSFILATLKNYGAASSEATIVKASSQIRLANATLPAGATGTAYYRPLGSGAAFNPLPKSANSPAGSWTADVDALADGQYEVVFIATGLDGNEANALLRRDQYTMTLSKGGISSLTADPIPARDLYADAHGNFQYDVTGTYLWQSPQVLTAYNLQSTDRQLADAVQLRVRPAGSQTWIYPLGQAPVQRDPATGAFKFDLSSLAGNMDVELALFKGGAVLDTLTSTVAFSGGIAPAFNFGFLRDKKTSITFNGLVPNTEYIRVKYNITVDGTVKTINKTIRKNGSGEFIWDTSDPANEGGSLTPDPYQAYTYDIVFNGYDAYGTVLSMGKGTVNLGGPIETAGGHNFILTGSEHPVVIEFVPRAIGDGPQQGALLTNASKLNLYFRRTPKTQADYERPMTLVTLTRNGEGRFLFNATEYGLPADTEYEYRYEAVDSAGTVLVERSSYFDTRTRTNPATNTDIIGVITETNKDMTIDRYERYNAFGEVSAERDGRGNWTDLYYNAQGKLIKKQQAEVMITLANGFQKVMRPETLFSYDRTGNLLGMKDANGNLTTQQWNYGTGKVAASWDAARYSKTSQYDQLGNLRIQSDELQQQTSYDYDNLGRLKVVTRGTGAQTSIDKYNYDEAGNRISTINTLTGQSNTYYDGDGRVIHTVSAEGRAVWYQYTWNSSIVSVGGTVSGGWQKVTTDANGHTLTDNIDTFGRVTWHQDMGGRTTSYAYNWAGLLASETSSAGKNIVYDYYSNGLVWTIKDNGTGKIAFYEYDGDGNRTYESYRSVTDAYVYTQARVVYDALNRVTSINDLLYSVTYEYDAVGNRRHMAATYHDYVQNTKQSQDYWYAYDGLNRFTVTMGQLSGARATSADDASVTVVAGSNGGDGVYLAYDAAGQRKLATYASDGRTELYNYDALGYLTTQTINGVKTSERTNDQLGRVTNYAEWLADGSKQVTNLVKTYDADGLQKTERDTINASTTTYTRLADGTLSQVKVVPDDADKSTTMTMNYAYEWWDGAKQSKITSQGTNPNAPGWKPANSLFNYDVNGNLKATFDDGGGELAKQRAFSYETDQQGQILRRNELGGVTINANDQVTGASTDRIHNFYYLNGHRIGNVGNDGIEKIDYVKELAGKLDKGNDNTYKIFTPISAVDFDENYMKISGNYPAMSADSWTVREGDTLQSIAAAMWGDSSLWYIIADANGLKGEDVLKAGQVLKVPNNVVNVHNTATTFKPYDPGLAIGNTQPTLPTPPPPPGKEGCGGIGTIIAIVVAIVATVFTAGAAALAMGAVASGTGIMTAGMAVLAGSIGGVGLGMAGVAAAAIGGAVGAAAGQGAMMAMGMQDSFNWKGVALGAISAGATSGVGSYFSAGAVVAPTATTANAANAAASSSISAADIAKAFGQGALRNVAAQGIGVATGVQQSFDWRGVAVSAIAQGVGQGVGAQIKGWSLDSNAAMDSAINVGARSVVAGFVGGVVSTAARGGSLGRNVGAITMDAVASTIGNSVVDSIAASSVQPKIYGLDNGGISAVEFIGQSGSSQHALDVAQRQGQADIESRLSRGPLFANSTGASDPIYISASGQPDIVMQPGRAYGQGIVYNTETETIGYAVPMPPPTDVRQLGELSPQVVSEASLMRRFADGAVGALKGVTVEPLLQIRDLALAGTSVVYNEVIRNKNDSMWLPEMKSGIAEQYSHGASQSRLLLQSNFVTGSGVLSYDATTALIHGQYGDLAEMAGGVAGGFALGKATQKYGAYGITIEDIGATGPLASQRGSVGWKLVGPNSADDVPRETAKIGDLLATHGKTMSNSESNRLVNSMKTEGIKNPLTVTENNGKLFVLDGNNRLFAAPRAGISEVPIVRVELPFGAYKSPTDLLFTP
ncbi:lysM domain protein [Collimonas fungivorans]|uniref:LysM domain protein n=1 Tax=Collimonas fungivorans TaxID=158899 RepID=A0A127PDT0_9BURK|nr:LysM peptidoglycan-binding domain-containing protein [Collimonas fungivorans]AMO95601.1 lysM domain protein [Collimonas fungivorans]